MAHWYALGLVCARSQVRIRFAEIMHFFYYFFQHASYTQRGHDGALIFFFYSKEDKGMLFLGMPRQDSREYTQVASPQNIQIKIVMLKLYKFKN